MVIFKYLKEINNTLYATVLWKVLDKYEPAAFDTQHFHTAAKTTFLKLQTTSSHHSSLFKTLFNLTKK